MLHSNVRSGGGTGVDPSDEHTHMPPPTLEESARPSTGAPVDIDTVADELYALRPEEFTAARNARTAEARTAGDRALADRIGKLRRPSLAAWVSNLLVRERPEETEALLRLGEALRRAHRDLDGARLRELTGQQRTLIRAVTREARELAAQAGHPVGDDVGREVEGTLHAVLADPEAAAEWATGRLVKPLEGTVGFPDVSPSVTVRKPAPRPGKRADAAEAARLRKDAEAARRELRAREKEASAAEKEAAEQRRRAEQLKERVAELTEELSRAKAEQREAAEEERRAREELRAAERRVREAGRRAEKAATRLAERQG